MNVRYCAQFGSSLPDDVIEDDDEIIQNGGKSVAAAVGEILGRLGCEVSAPVYAGDHGWEFQVKTQGCRLWCEVTIIHDYLLQLYNTSWADKFFGRHPAGYLDTLRALGRELASDARFINVRWYLPRDVGSGEPGAISPLD